MEKYLILVVFGVWLHLAGTEQIDPRKCRYKEDDYPNCHDINGDTCHLNTTDLCTDYTVAHLLCPVTCCQCDRFVEWDTAVHNLTKKCGDGITHICEGVNCSTKLAERYCSKTCFSKGFQCEDHIHSEGLNCSTLPNVCETPAGYKLCAAFCDLCDINILFEMDQLGKCEEAVCEDDFSYVGCHEPEVCNSPLARDYCPKTCNLCTTKPTTTLSTTSASTTAPTLPTDTTPTTATSPPATPTTTTTPPTDTTTPTSAASATTPPTDTSTSTTTTTPPTDTSTSTTTTTPPTDTTTPNSVTSTTTPPTNTSPPTDTSPPTTTTTPITTPPTTPTITTTTIKSTTTTPVSATTPTTPTPTTPTPTTTTPTTSTPTSSTPITSTPPNTTPATPPPTSTTSTTTTTTTTTTATSTSTTTTPESTTTTEPTTTAAAASLPGSRCHTCGNYESGVPCNGINILLPQFETCDDSKPYCMNDISQINNNGAVTIKRFKRCVDEDTCNTLWFEGSSDVFLCVNFEPDKSSDDLDCHLCCYGDECNRPDVPPANTRYHP